MDSKDIYYSVCEIITKNEKYVSNGTCFLYENNSILYVVSNKHVLFSICVKSKILKNIFN